LRPQENSVAVLLDTSSSMTYGEGEQSRLQQAVSALIESALPALEDTFTVDLYGFVDGTTRLESLADVPAPSATTPLSDALLSVLRGAQSGTLGAVVLVQDGMLDREQPLQFLHRCHGRLVPAAQAAVRASSSRACLTEGRCATAAMKRCRFARSAMSMPT